MKIKHWFSMAVLSAQLVSGAAFADGPRNYLYVVGSTTIAPFTEAVAARLAKSAKFKMPLLESNGTNGGIMMFCEGVGMDFPDMVNASRPMKKSEYAACQKNGVGDILEIKIGFDGLVAAYDKKAKPGDMTRKELYLALAKEVPDPSCKDDCDKLVPNPHKTWKQINPAFGDVKIEIYGPPFNSGSVEVLAEAVMESGCNSFPWLRAMKAKNEVEYNRHCHNIRNDGAYIEETGELIPSRLQGSPEAVGIITFPRYKEHAAKLQAAKLEGVAPSYESLASQTYPITRPLYVYVKKSHIPRIPGYAGFLAELTSDKAAGPKGYLLEKGLVGLPTADLKAVQQEVKSERAMTPP